jgi:hypothetical protein
MLKLRRFGTAVSFSLLAAIGILTFSTPAYAAQSTGICKALARGLILAERLPDGELKAALIAYLQQEQAEYGCNN